MSKKHWKIKLIILVAVFLLGLSYYYGVFHEEEAQENSNYSVVLYQRMDNEWFALTQGIRQAEQDFGVNINYIYLDKEDDGSKQAEILEKELASETDGILLAAVDSEYLRETIANLNEVNTILAVETGAGDACIKISGNDRAMGYDLGKKILEDMRQESQDFPKEVIVIKEFMERESVKSRYEGLMEALGEAEEELLVKEVSRLNENQSMQIFLQDIFLQKSIYVAALDKYMAEETILARDRMILRSYQKPEDSHIYGIGNTTQMVSALDSGKLSALVFQNEFNMGYEGIRAMIEKEKKGYIIDQFQISHKLVTRETLYEPENERMLFPSI